MKRKKSRKKIRKVKRKKRGNSNKRKFRTRNPKNIKRSATRRKGGKRLQKPKRSNRKTSKAIPRRIKHRRNRISKQGRFRDSKGRFTTRKKWERLNLPKKKRKQKPKSKANKWVEGDEYVTPGFRYRYRQFELLNWSPENIQSVIDFIVVEGEPQPIFFYVHVEYKDKDGVDQDFGTPPYEWDVSSAGIAADDLDGLAMEYQFDTAITIEMLVSYSITNKLDEKDLLIRSTEEF
jgi:hypothetical protein